MIQHVALEVLVQDVEAEVAFWGLLGFVEVEPPSASLRERSRWLERAGTQIHLMWLDDPVAPPKGHVAVVLPDWVAGIAALEDAGFAVDQRERHWGAGRAFVRSPAGHTVEVMDFAPTG